MLDLSSIKQEPRRWVRLSGALDGFEVEIRHCGMKDRSKFRHKMIRDGILNKTGEDSNPGREADFMQAYVDQFVTGWRVPERFRSADAKDANPEYNPKGMAEILDASPQSFKAIVEAVEAEADFFTVNGDGGST